MDTTAVVLGEPRRVGLRVLSLDEAGPEDAVVDVRWSGISTGTERLLWSGRMPAFPGMGYPLVPGYESVGRVRRAGEESGRREGEWVFVPGARCFGEVRGLFGASASRVVAPGEKLVPVPESLADRGTLMALAATAYHAIMGSGGLAPELIVGHGALGRLMARLTVARTAVVPTVWETRPERRGDASYPVIHPAEDERRDYRSIYDASGDAGLIDELIGRLAPRGELVLAGFYDHVSFRFPPAFLRELRLRVAAEWKPSDLRAVATLAERGELSLEGIVSHRAEAHDDAGAAYEAAFEDSSCLKMVFDWGEPA